MAVMGPATDAIRARDEHYKISKELFDSSNKHPPIENLVFEGGGVKGIVYLGVLQALEDAGLMKDVKRVLGSSAGSIISMIISLGYNAQECEEILRNELDLNALMDQRCQWDPKIKTPIGIPVGISTVYHLFKHKGAFKGEVFTQVLESLVAKKLNQKIQEYILIKNAELFDVELELCVEGGFSPQIIQERKDSLLKDKVNQFLDEQMIDDLGKTTFGQMQALNNVFSEYPHLKGLDLYVAGTRLTDGSLKVFSHIHDANMPIALAVRISSSFPGGFEPVYYQGHYYTDGGVADNFSINYFDREASEETKFLLYGRDKAGGNPATLGFLVDSEEEIRQRWGIASPDAKKDLSVMNMIKHVAKAYRNRLEEIKEKHGTHAVQIYDTGIKTMELDLRQDKAREAIRVGRETTENYIMMYMGKDVEYKLMNYEDLYQRYFSMSEVQLQDRLQSLGSHLAQASAVLDILGARDIESDIAQVEQSLEAFEEHHVQAQEKLFYTIIDSQQETWVINENIELIGDQVKTLECSYKRLQKQMQDHVWALENQKLTQTQRQKHIHETQALATQIQSIISEHGLKVDKIEALYIQEQAVKEKIQALEVQQRAEIYDLIYQKDALEKIEDEFIVESLEEVCEQYHEHLDVIFQAMDAKGMTVRDPRFEPPEILDEQHLLDYAQISFEEDGAREAFGEPRELDEFDHALALHELIHRLATGNWSDYIQFTTRSDMVHNQEHMHTIGEETFGQFTSAFQVQHIKTVPVEKLQYKSYRKEIESPPIEAHILSPEPITLESSTKKVKEIIMVFQDPLRDEGEAIKKTKNYSLTAKLQKERARHFEQCKEQFLKQIKWQLRKIHQAQLQPADAKIHLKIAGNGMGAMDAQLMMAELIKVLNDPDKPEYAGLDQIELVLQDAPRVSEQMAQSFARDVAQVKNRPKSPDFKIYHINHRETKKYFQPECYFGITALSTHVNPEHMEVTLDERSHRNRLLEKLSNQQPNAKSKLYESLNRHHWMYESAWYRQYRTLMQSAKKFFDWLIFKFAPTMANIVYGIFKFHMMLVIGITKIPFRIASSLFKKLKKLFKGSKPKKIKNWQASIQGAKDKKVAAAEDVQIKPKSLDEKAQQFTSKAKASKRLKREQRPPVQNIVLSGGGINNIAMIGALKSLEKHGKLEDVQRLAGASFGAVISSLFAVGYSIEEIEKIVFDVMNLDKLADPACSWDPTLFNPI